MTHVLHLSSWWNKFLVSLFISIQSIVYVSGRILPHNFEKFPTTSLFVSLLVFQQLRSNLLGRVLSKLICGRSWHFLLQYVIPMIYLLFFLPEALWCCSLHSSSRIEDHVLFMHIQITEVLCHLFKFFSSYQVLHLFSTGVLSEFVLPCSSFLTECFQLCSSSLFSSFHFARPLKVHGFHSFVKEATLFYLSSSVFPPVPA